MNEEAVEELLAEFADPAIEIENPQSHLSGFKSTASKVRWTTHLVSSLLVILGTDLLFWSTLDLLTRHTADPHGDGRRCLCGMVLAPVLVVSPLPCMPWHRLGKT